MYESSTDITVRYVETDQMGIVHHSNHFPWFEVGRTDFIKTCGMSYSELESIGIFLPLYNCSCDFIKGAKYEDELIIKTTLKELSPVRCIFSYNIIKKADSSKISEGQTCHAFTDSKLRPINIKKKFKEIFDNFQKLL